MTCLGFLKPSLVGMRTRMGKPYFGGRISPSYLKVSCVCIAMPWLRQRCATCGLMHRSKKASLLNPLIGAGEQRGWDFNAGCFRRFQVADQFELGHPRPRSMLESDPEVRRMCFRGRVGGGVPCQLGGLSMWLLSGGSIPFHASRSPS